MNRNDEIFFSIGPEIEKKLKINSEVPDYGDKILIRNPYKYYIYCEGLAERRYLTSLKSYFNSSRLDVCVFNPDQKNHEGCDAKSLVDQFVIQKEGKIKEEDYLEDENKFFLIFDRDNNCLEPMTEHEKHISYCLRKCKKNFIAPIFSNPCFEVWLICQYDKPEKKDFPEKARETKQLHVSIKDLPSNKMLGFEKKLSNAKTNSEVIYEERISANIHIHSQNSYPVTEMFKLIKILEDGLGSQ